MNKLNGLLTGLCLAATFTGVDASEKAGADVGGGGGAGAGDGRAPLQRKGSIAMAHEKARGAVGEDELSEMQHHIMEAKRLARELAKSYHAPESRQARIFTRMAADLQNLVEEADAAYMLRIPVDDQQNARGYIDRVNRVTKPGSDKAAWK